VGDFRPKVTQNHPSMMNKENLETNFFSFKKLGPALFNFVKPCLTLCRNWVMLNNVPSAVVKYTKNIKHKINVDKDDFLYF
jgi:hypothetical protein